jgi:hypothetical protein
MPRSKAATVKKPRKERPKLPETIQVEVSDKKLTLRLHVFDAPAGDTDVDRWIDKDSSLRRLELPELKYLLDVGSAPELTALVGICDLIPWGCYIQVEEARFPAQVILSKSGKITNSPNWCRNDLFRWPPESCFMAVEIAPVAKKRG